MYYSDLQSFIAQLDDHDVLERVKTTTEPHLEVSSRIVEECKKTADSKALLFESITGSHMTLAANLFGSMHRTAMALGVTDVESLAGRLRQDLMKTMEQDYGSALASVIRGAGIDPVSYEAPQCFDVNSRPAGLKQLPALQSWPGDGGRYLTLAQVMTRHPDSGQQNCGMYRVQVIDDQTALIRFHPGSGGGQHLAMWHERDEAMPIAIVLGGPPALTWCAGVPLPSEVSEYEFISYLTGQSVPVTEGQNTGLLVPATAEVVIEGEIKPDDCLMEGPFANHTGYYTPAALAPVIKIKSIRMRNNAVYPCTVVGPPPQENIFMARAVERILLPLVQHINPWVVNVHMPSAGIYHRGALVTVDTTLSVREISTLLRESPLLRNSRLLVILDKETDPRDAENIYWRVINADDWQRSVLIDDDQMTIDARKLKEKVSIQ